MAEENSFNVKNIKQFNEELREAKSLSAILMGNINSLGDVNKGNIGELKKDVRDITKSFTQLSLLNANVKDTNISINRVKGLQAKLDEQILSLSSKREFVTRNELWLAEEKEKVASREFREAKAQLEVIKQTRSAHKTEIKVQKEKIANLQLEFEKRAGISAKIQGTLETSDLILKTLIKSRNNVKDYEEDWLRANKALGVTGKLIKSISRVPILGQIIDADEALKSMRKSALEGAGSLGLLWSGISSSLKTFSALDVALASISYLVKQSIKANKEIVGIGKSFGFANEKALAFRGNLIRMERSTDNINVYTETLYEAFSQLNTETGYIAQYSADALTTQIKLTRQVGLTAGEASKFYEIGVLTNTSSENTYKNFIKGAVGIKNSTRSGINLLDVIKESSQLSGQVALNLGFLPSKLTEAVGVAKSLGFEMNQLKTIGSSLLNFESSISAEMKAEVVSGKKMNLERARYAALMGDQVTLSQEIAKNVGTIGEYQKLNVIQQNTIAEAFGLTSDEITNILRKQKLSIENGKSLAQITKEEATSALERQDVQQKFSNSMFKLQSLFINLVSNPLSDFVDGLSNSLNFVNSIGAKMDSWFGKKGLGGVGKLITAIPAIAIATTMIGSIAYFMTKGTMRNPMWVASVTGGGGGGSSWWNGKAAGGQMAKGGGRLPKGARVGGMKNNLMGGLKGGGGLALGGSLAASLVSSQMGDGIARDVVDGLGTTLGMAGTGAMIGSVIPVIGTGIGAIAGGIVGLTMSVSDYMEQNKEDADRMSKWMERLYEKDSNVYIDKEKLGVVASGIGQLNYKLS